MEVHLQHQVADENMDRFYCVTITMNLFGDPGVERNWGRVGTCGQTRLDWYDDRLAARKAMSDFVSAKLRKGYELSGGTVRQVSGHQGVRMS